MTQQTVEQLKAEVEKLTDKVSQLIGEKRKVQGERDELKAQFDMLEGESAANKEKLEYLTIHAPRLDEVEAIAYTGMKDTLWRELNIHFNIARTEAGDIFTDKEGEPITVEGKPVPMTAEGIRTLSANDLMEGLPSMIKASGMSGGGATGSNGVSTSYSTKTSAPKVQFGMR